jgi:hypothetical protein
MKLLEVLVKKTKKEKSEFDIESEELKRQNKIVKRIRRQVISSTEIIANEVLRFNRQSPLPSFQKYNLEIDEDRLLVANILFQQSLTYVLRILVKLFCESHYVDKLDTIESIYEQSLVGDTTIQKKLGAIFDEFYLTTGIILFNQKSTPLVSGSLLRDEIMQQVVKNLLFA